MKKQLHPNFSKSSNLLFATVLLILIGMFLGKVILSFDANNIYLEFLNIFLIGGLGLLVRLGFKWVKYLPLMLSFLYFIEAYSFLLNSSVIQIPQVLFIGQIILVVWSTILLFRIPKKDIDMSLA
jgi:hypothetical protein